MRRWCRPASIWWCGVPHASLDPHFLDGPFLKSSQYWKQMFYGYQDGLRTMLIPMVYCMLPRMLLGGRAGYITVQCRLWQRASSFACSWRAVLVVLILTIYDNPAMERRHSLLVPGRYDLAQSSVMMTGQHILGLVQTSAVPCEVNATPFSFQFQCRKTND